jgi:hypothetical protein
MYRNTIAHRAAAAEAHFGERRRSVGERRAFRPTPGSGEKKPASGGFSAASGESGQRHGWLVLDLVVVFGFGGCLLDRLARDVGALDFFALFLAAVLGFVFVTDTLGHETSPVVEPVNAAAYYMLRQTISARGPA